MKKRPSKEDRIVTDVAHSFPVFGGGKGSEFNPLTEMLKDRAPMFAMGVDVREVVRFVMHSLKKATP